MLQSIHLLPVPGLFSQAFHSLQCEHLHCSIERSRHLKTCTPVPAELQTDMTLDCNLLIMSPLHPHFALMFPSLLSYFTAPNFAFFTVFILSYGYFVLLFIAPLSQYLFPSYSLLLLLVLTQTVFSRSQTQ